jgi:ketosteroid isomerase-like protein
MNGEQDADAREIERLANAWMNAGAERDAATLERIMGEEFRLASGRGVFVDRAEWLRMAFEEIEVESFAYADVSVRTYGDVAVMQSRWRQRARLRGDDWSGEGLLTDVWVRRDGRWQVVARHSSLVSTPS